MSLRRGQYFTVAFVAAVAAAVAAYFVGARAAPATPPAAVASAQDEYLFACRHDRTSEWECPDTAAVSFRPASSDISSVTVLVITKSGRAHAVTLPPTTDAVFLGKSATERLLVPYYDRTNPAKAAALRAELQRRGRQR